MTAAIAALLAVTSPTAWPELPVAEARIGPWSLSVMTFVDQSSKPPTIESIRCRVRRPGFQLLLSHYGTADFYLGGEGTGFTLTGIKSVTIDDSRWEAQLVPLRPTERYADVEYPEGHPVTLGEDTDAYLGVRRTADEPWLSYTTLVDEVAEGRTLAVEHSGGTFRWSLARLPEALRWCTSTMQSKRARQFRR